MLIVRFEGTPPRRKIPNFADVLVQGEGSGILNWALEGLQMLLEDIKNYGDINLTTGQVGRIEALLSESNSLKNFLMENVINDDEGDLSVAELVEAYAEYCPTKGWNPKPITVVHKEIEGLLLELYHTAKVHDIKRDGKNQRGFRHVRLFSDTSDT